jgi:hypothetical protein
MTFLPAIDQMNFEGRDVYGPVSFQSYLELHGLPARRTAEAISVDALDKLSLELRNHHVMVFRLGRGDSASTTQFALARSKSDFRDFFLDDNQLKENITPESFVPLCSFRNLFSFQLMPALTETSLVNLALASGLLGSALNLDEPADAAIPATGQSTFSFHVKPFRDSDIRWRHECGQVEIDAIFAARRAGKDVLFVVEAKVSNRLKTLAKHKLVYPVLSIQPHLPPSLPIVPVYLRIVRTARHLNFFVTECCMSIDAAIDGLSPVGKTKWFQLTGF